MRIVTIFMAVLCLVAATAPANAQDVVGSKSDVRGAQALQSVGHCLASERMAWSEEMVVLDYRSDRYRTLAKRLREYAPACNEFRRGLRTSGLIFAGAIAEGVLIEKGLLAELGDHVAYDPAMPAIEAMSAEDVFAYCVVRKAPEAVAALLETTITSDEELAQLKAMAPVLPTCVPEGQKPAFTREALRSLFALAAYRLYAHRQRHGESASA